MSGAGARQAGDDDRRQQLDVVDLGVARQQVGEQQPVLQPLQQLGVEVDDSRPVQSVDLVQRGEIDVEALAVVVGAEIVEPGLGAGLGVQCVGVERAVGRHRRHHVADLLGLGLKRGSARSSSWTTAAVASVTATYVTLSFVMTTDLGRPRDPRIDDAVLRATVELLGETGYADLSVDAIAERAGTSKPAIYRRWPSKAHLVHEAVFPIAEATELPDTGSLAGDVREMVRRTTARADHAGGAGGAARAGRRDGRGPDAARRLLERFGDILSRGLTDRLERRDGARRGHGPT